MYDQSPSLTVRNLTGIDLFIWKSFQGGFNTPRSEVPGAYGGGGGGGGTSREERISVRDNVDAEIKINEGSEALNIQLVDGVWKPFRCFPITSGNSPSSPERDKVIMTL